MAWLDKTIIIGFLAANAWPQIQKGLTFLFNRVVNLLFVRLEVQEFSQFYYGLQEYILTERSEKIKNLHYQTFYDDWRVSSDGMKNPRKPLLYNYGFQFVWFEGSLMFIHKGISNVNNTMDVYKNQLHQFSIFSLNRTKLERFIEYVDKKYGKSYLKYYYSKDSTPKLGGAIMNKTFDNIFLEGGVIERLKTDLDLFMSSREIYEKLGVRYKRTYLFWGPPGTGKSSLSTAIANYTNRNIFTITPSKDMTDSVLVSLISNKPPESIIVFEDFDCLLSTINREEKTSGENRINISISCLLNILDGTYTPDNTIFIITTNDLDKIDSAIKRKGRTDLLIEIPKPSQKFLSDLKEKFGIESTSEIDSIQDIQNLIIERH